MRVVCSSSWRTFFLLNSPIYHESTTGWWANIVVFHLWHWNLTSKPAAKGNWADGKPLSCCITIDSSNHTETHQPHLVHWLFYTIAACKTCYTNLLLVVPEILGIYQLGLVFNCGCCAYVDVPTASRQGTVWRYENGIHVCISLHCCSGPTRAQFCKLVESGTEKLNLFMVFTLFGAPLCEVMCLFCLLWIGGIDLDDYRLGDGGLI